MKKDQQQQIKRLQTSPKLFRESLKIDADGRPQPFQKVVNPFQIADFEALDEAWMRVVGTRKESPKHARGWIERPRGHSKSSDVMISVIWALFSSYKSIKGIVAACDKDQSAINIQHTRRIVQQNSWLKTFIKISSFQISNPHTGSSCDIISSDVASSYGLLIDFAVLDEVSIWTDRHLFDSLFSAAAKKSTCLLLAIQNAGFQDSWQWDLREKIRQDPNWYFSRLENPVASWISPKILEEQQRLLPNIAYQRLWLNRWTSGSGDALEEDDINRSITLSGPQPPSRECTYVLGLDLGIKRDFSAAVVLGVHMGHTEEREKPRRPLSGLAEAMVDIGEWDEPDPEFEVNQIEGTGRIHVAQVLLWKPPKDGRVDLEDVESSLLKLDKLYHFQAIGYDPYQMEHMSQRLIRAGLPMVAVGFVPQNLQSMAQKTMEAFVNGKIDLYPQQELVQDLRNLRIEERQYGIRLVSPRTATGGHGDCVTALSIGLHVLGGLRFAVDSLQESDTIICE